MNLNRAITAILMVTACLVFSMRVNDAAVSAQIKVGQGGSIAIGQNASFILSSANTWTALNVFTVGIQLSNNAAVSADNLAGTAGQIVATDTSNDVIFGDSGNIFAGALYIDYAGSPIITMTSGGGLVFNQNPKFTAFTLNGSQSLTGVYGNGSSLPTTSGGWTVGDCLNVASGNQIGDAGAACGSGGGGISSFTTNGTSGAATYSGGTLNIPVYASTGPLKCNVTIPATAVTGGACTAQVQIAGSSCSPSVTGFTASSAFTVTAQGDYSATVGWSPILNPVIPILHGDATANTIDYKLCLPVGSSSETTGAFGARIVITP